VPVETPGVPPAKLRGSLVQQNVGIGPMVFDGSEEK